MVRRRLRSPHRRKRREQWPSGRRHRFGLYVGLESAAAHLHRYDESLIPGLLQTKEYARALYRLGGMLSEEERDRALAVRCAGPNGG
ncbi:Scr1 family TA system antitoxin-like transcriptional regulator [Micromonospora sp. B9E7]|uniref:Scr1 family TA system antitoxin-like transcriptional regulator n=1 Tax=Micromonospora sp. B9E7 TaxID=3153574 RepID=UPI00325E092A